MRLLIDGDVLLHKAAAAGRTEVQWTPDVYSLSMDVGLAAATADEILADWTERLGGTEVILAFSDPARRYFRHELWPDYKAGRSAILPGWLDLLGRVSDGHETVTWRRLEADDVLGILATQPDGGVIVSIDKDMRSVPCRLWNPDRADEGVWTISEEEADYAHLLQTLAGDRVDGYPGCPGLGVKRGAALLDAAEEEWPAVVAAYERAGLAADYALVQARVARILRAGDYDPRDASVRLWEPPA